MSDKLTPEDEERLIRISRVYGRMENWWKINKAIGKFIFFTAIGLLIVLSQGFDAIRNLLGWKH